MIDGTLEALLQLQRDMMLFATTAPSPQQTRHKSAREMVEHFAYELKDVLARLSIEQKRDYQEGFVAGYASCASGDDEPKPLEAARAAVRDTPQPQPELVGEPEFVQVPRGLATAREQHLKDVYAALGVRWGDDPFPVIAKLRAARDTPLSQGREACIHCGRHLGRICQDCQADIDAARVREIQQDLDAAAGRDTPPHPQELGELRCEAITAKHGRCVRPLDHPGSHLSDGGYHWQPAATGDTGTGPQQP